MSGRLETMERILPHPPRPSLTLNSLLSAPVLPRTVISSQTYWDREGDFKVPIYCEQSYCAQPVSRLTRLAAQGNTTLTGLYPLRRPHTWMSTARGQSKRHNIKLL